MAAATWWQCQPAMASLLVPEVSQGLEDSHCISLLQISGAGLQTLLEMRRSRGPASLTPAAASSAGTEMRLKAAWSLITPQLVVVQQVLVLEDVWVHLLIRSRLLCWLVLKARRTAGAGLCGHKAVSFSVSPAAVALICHVFHS